MAAENEFEPRLGRIRARGSRKDRKYLHRVLAAMNLAGRASTTSPFKGNRIGRGSGIGRVLASRDRLAAYRQRRVIIKSRIVKLAGKGLAGARAHLRYIQRDGVTREGERGALYGPGGAVADGRAFHERSADDRHQFRFIVSPEDGGEYDSLRPLTCRLMAQMEEDLGSRLEWVAVDHFNTGHPHVHVMLRGVDDQGRDLVIARDYLATGMRERAAELVQLDLGPRSELEIERALASEMEQERFTSLDRRLFARAGPDGLVRPDPSDPARQTLLTGRLRKLERLGLAVDLGAGRWRLASDLEPTLRRLGERGDIIKTMHRELSRSGRTTPAADMTMFDPAAPDQRSITGRIVARGLADELRDRHFLVLEATDGRSHYVDIGKADAVEPLPGGAIVRISARGAEVRAADRTVADIAAANGGRYDVDIHLKHDPAASQAFAQAHVRRLEAMRRATGAPTRVQDGSWRISESHLAHAEAFENMKRKDRPVRVEILSRLGLDQQVAAEGPTWLDRTFAAPDAEPLRNAGFGREAEAARARRRLWLIAQGLLSEAGTGPVADLVERLRARELAQMARTLAGELGRPYRETAQGERIEGKLRRAVDLAGGRYALIERSRDFTLVPWRPVLEGREGQFVGGVSRGKSISWTVGRGRPGPTL